MTDKPDTNTTDESTESHILAHYLKKNPKNGIPMSNVKRKITNNHATRDSLTTATETVKRKHELVQDEDFKPDIKNSLSDAPQIRLIDGRIALDEESLVTSRQSEQIDRERVEETQKRITSASFRKKTIPRDRWSAQEEKLLYEGLSVWGTDFGIISQYLKGKTREQIKNKFKKEEKIYPFKIRDALSERKSFDGSIFHSIKR